MMHAQSQYYLYETMNFGYLVQLLSVYWQAAPISWADNDDTPASPYWLPAGELRNFIIPCLIVFGHRPIHLGIDCANKEPGALCFPVCPFHLPMSSHCSDSGITVEKERRLRREIANSNERRRMQSINLGYQSLRSMLPLQRETATNGAAGEKLSKVR